MGLLSKWPPSLCALTLLSFFLVNAAPAQEQVVDEIVAVVADKIILRSDVDALLLGIMQQQQQPYSDSLWRQSLNSLVDQAVLAEHARRDTNITVTEDQVEQSLDQRISVLTQQLGSTARLEQVYGQSVEEIRDELRDTFRERLLAEQFQNTKLNTINVTPSEVREWFAQFPADSLPIIPTTIRASHIVRHPQIPQSAENEALEVITAIRDSIMTGNSTLEEMARRFSEDTGSAANGGRYDDMVLGDLVPEFAAVASRSTPGQLSAPFRSPFGYHILRVDQRIGEQVDFTHVLINVDRRLADPAEAIELLAALRDSLLTTPVPFEVLARRHSEEEFSSEIGGRIVDPQTGERDLFLDALGDNWKQLSDTLEIGEISTPGPVTLLDGSLSYHIVQIQRIVPEHRVDIETDYARIEQLALGNKRNTEMRKWLDNLREDVFVELRGKGDDLLGTPRSSASN